MKHADRFDSLIQYWAGAYGMDWLLIKAQAQQESGMNPLAMSTCGAQGLLQLMPATASELKITHAFDVDSNLRGGIFYLRDQYRHFPEIIDDQERWKFALAAYNCGRGNVNRAIAVVRLRKQDWQQWAVVAAALATITGERSAETIGYVGNIMQHWQELQSESENT